MTFTCAGVNPDHESRLSQSPALLLLRRHDLPGLHFLRLDRAGPLSREGEFLKSSRSGRQASEKPADVNARSLQLLFLTCSDNMMMKS